MITKLGKIAEDFEHFSLIDELRKNDAGEWGNEPDENAVGVIRSTNFTNYGKLDLTDVAFRTISEKKLKSILLEENDILIERSGGSDSQPVGRVGFINKEIATGNYVYANFIQRIAVNDNIDATFTYYCLQQMYEMGITNSMQYQTTGIRNLDYKLFIKSIFPKPLIHEQRKIASILTKVDDAIEAVKKTIEKAERVKKAFMQNLLTGKLKPDSTWRKDDEFYIDEKFGKYPKEWSFGRFKQFSVLQRGKDLTDNEVVQGIYPVVKSNGIQIYHNCYFVEPPGVVTGRSGTIGKVFYIEEKFWAHNTSLYIKDFKGNNEKYIYYLIMRMKFDQYYAGTTVPTLNRNDVHKVKVALPKDIDEQIAIVNKIDSVQNIIENKFQKIQKLERLKKALMQNLLTGKVRVKV